MRIVIFNLRDVRNPSAGGAEVFTHQVARRWVSQGHSVLLISSCFRGGRNEEAIDGVTVRRMGNAATVAMLARRHYRRSLKGLCDFAIDEYTLRPFGAPKFVTEPVLFLVHELAREKYFYELPPVASHLFYYLLEPRWIRQYRRIHTIAVSESTKTDLLAMGFEHVHVVPEGIDFLPEHHVPIKEEENTLIYVGLLKKVNLVDHAIEAFREVSLRFPDAQLWVVGRGPEMGKLKRLAGDLNVTFFGFVSDERKLELMRRAHALVIPAIREGWGLVVTEANASATPAIGYRVPGLRDSISHEQTGLLTNPDQHSLASAIIRFLESRELRVRLTENALRDSRKYSWDITADAIMRVMETVANAR